MSEIEFVWADDIGEEPVSVYGEPAYQRMVAALDGSDARILECRLQGGKTYLPMLVRELGGGKKEACSAYGYGGTLGQVQLTDEAVHSLCRFLADASILALFVRHSPFLMNHRRWPESRIELNRHTYATALRPCENFQDYLAGIPQKLRWSVNFARRAGLEVDFFPLASCSERQLRSFYQLYSELMREKQTGSHYFFSETFFLTHAQALGARGELAQIVDPQSGQLLAAAFFLLDSTGWAHYHLSAARSQAMKRQGMELLLGSAIFRYGNRNFHAMHLGGGHALDELDGLSRFKAKFASERLDFFCTKLVCDEPAYQRERDKIPLQNPKLFLISDALGK